MQINLLESCRELNSVAVSEPLFCVGTSNDIRTIARLDRSVKRL